MIGKWFKRRRERPSVMGGLFTRMGGVIDQKLRQAAQWLNTKAAGWSKQKTLTGLVVVCVLAGAWSAMIIWQSFHSPSSAVKVRAIRVPKHSIIKDESLPPRIGLSAREVASIKRLGHWVDSLQESASGQLVYDSVMQVRPGLLDSLRQLQEHFSEQLKISEHERKK